MTTASTPSAIHRPHIQNPRQRIPDVTILTFASQGYSEAQQYQKPMAQVTTTTTSSEATPLLHDHSTPNGTMHLHRPQKYIPLNERLNHFTWSWFECTMSTGAIATLLGQQPFGFTGLK